MKNPMPLKSGKGSGAPKPHEVLKKIYPVLCVKNLFYKLESLEVSFSPTGSNEKVADYIRRESITASVVMEYDAAFIITAASLGNFLNIPNI